VNGIHEVTGSIPVSSTNSSNDLAARRNRPQGRSVYFLSILVRNVESAVYRTLSGGLLWGAGGHALATPLPF
jgi:hypothetical protein